MIKLDNDRIPEDPREWVKRDTMIMNMVKEDLKSGHTLEWGMFAGGRLSGNAVCEGDELEVTVENMKYAPFVRMRAYPVMGPSQVEEMMKMSQDKGRIRLISSYHRPVPAAVMMYFYWHIEDAA